MTREEAIEYWEGLRKTFSSQIEKETLVVLPPEAGGGTEMSGLISVKDRLPEPKEKAICINRHLDCMIGTYTEWGWMFPCYYDKPTHWMPMPEPPKEVKK